MLKMSSFVIVGLRPSSRGGVKGLNLNTGKYELPRKLIGLEILKRYYFTTKSAVPPRCTAVE